MASALSISLLLVLSLCTANAARDLSAAVHDLLPLYGLPKGLLPSSADTYTISADRVVTVPLPAPCDVKFTPFDLARYDTVVTGRVSQGQVTGITGISVQKSVIWFNVTAVEATLGGSMLVFKSGLFTELLPSSLFKNVSSCQNTPTLLVEAWKLKSLKHLCVSPLYFVWPWNKI